MQRSVGPLIIWHERVTYHFQRQRDISAGIVYRAVDWPADLGRGAIEIDGHRFEEVLNAYDEAMKVEDRPSVIIAHTVKGKNISFIV